MCLLCDDEKAYAAYMNYLDAMARQGKVADPDKAVDAVLDQLEAADKANHKSDDPANDKTLSPFFAQCLCDGNAGSGAEHGAPGRCEDRRG